MLKIVAMEFSAAMSTHNIDTDPVELLRRQYFQVVDPALLSIPESKCLKNPLNQHLIYQDMFDQSNMRYPPPLRYQFLVLKKIIAALEVAIEEPDEDVCS